MARWCLLAAVANYIKICFNIKRGAFGPIAMNTVGPSSNPAQDTDVHVPSPPNEAYKIFEDS
jgi:hypothetical protein